MTAARVQGVYLSGAELRAVAFAVNFTLNRLATERGQRPTALVELSRILSECPQSDTPEQDQEHTHHDGSFHRMTAGQVAEQLGMSDRNVRRLAPKLGGHLIGGRWMFNPNTIEQHIEGQQSA